MKKELRSGLRTWIEIDTKSIAHNYRVFRSMIPKECKYLSVVKSNAYGHGLVDFAREAEKLGADYLGVDSVVEGLTLRREGIKLPILVLGYTLPEMVEEAALHDITISVSHFESLLALSKRKGDKKISVHIKVDTGMHRQGFFFEDRERLMKELKKLSAVLSVDGLYTHFAAAKNPAFPAYTVGQIDEFKQWITEFKKVGFSPIVHASATAGTILFPQAHFDMVRIGIGQHGVWPAREVRAWAEDKFTLKPTLTWKAIISEVKVIPAGGKIGYDLTETVTKDTKVGVCPIGYWHGFPRALSAIGKVTIGGCTAKVLGRVSMDMIVLDVSNVEKVKVGDEVTLIDSKLGSGISADDMAGLADGSVYEILTRVNPLIKRFYI